MKYSLNSLPCKWHDRATVAHEADRADDEEKDSLDIELKPVWRTYLVFLRTWKSKAGKDLCTESKQFHLLMLFAQKNWDWNFDWPDYYWLFAIFVPKFGFRTSKNVHKFYLKTCFFIILCKVWFSNKNHECRFFKFCSDSKLNCLKIGISH